MRSFARFERWNVVDALVAKLGQKDDHPVRVIQEVFLNVRGHAAQEITARIALSLLPQQPCCRRKRRKLSDVRDLNPGGTKHGSAGNLSPGIRRTPGLRSVLLRIHRLTHLDPKERHVLRIPMKLGG